MQPTRRDVATCLSVALTAARQSLSAQTARYKPTTEPYVHPTVWKPFPDGIRLEVPDAVAGQSKARWGFVDVTEDPFGADPSGKADSTAAIQRAVDLARDSQMVCWFPAGHISCLGHHLLHRAAIPALERDGCWAAGQLFPCVLMGSRSGERASAHCARASRARI